MRSEDEVFVARCLEGDQTAFAFLVDKYKEVVHAYAYRNVGDYQQAEDIAQEVFIKAYRKLAQLKWPHKFRSWLYTIVSNECKLWLRNHSKEQEQEISWDDVPSENLDELAVRNHSDEDIDLTVRSAMETLPDDRQVALSLFYMSSMSVREIAHFMGVSPNSVKIKLHRGRRQLGEELEKMIGKHLSKEKLKAGFVFKLVDAIRDMPIPSLPKPRPIRWAPIPISIGLAILIGIIGYGVSSGRDIPPDMPILKPTTFSVSLLPDPDRQAVLDTELENTINLVAADAGTPEQTQSATGTRSSGIVVHRVSDSAQDLFGAVSPDRRYLSYVNWDKGNMAIHDLETGKNKDVTDEGHWGKDSELEFGDISIWSPDSKQIAYLWYKGPNTNLRTVGIDGSRHRVLYSSPTESGMLFPQAWSQDGKHILAIHWKQDKPHDILLVSVADASIHVLRSLARWRPIASWDRISLSPDGRYVTYDSPQSEDSPDRDIFVFSADGSHEMTLVEHPANDFAPFWAPDGNQIVFASDRSGSVGIWVLDVVDGKPKGTPQLISDNLNGMLPLGLTRDGSYYYGLQGRTNDVYLADLDPETGKIVKPPTKAVQTFEGLNTHADFSPDGKRLVYISHRGPGGWRSSSFVIRSLETGEERELQPNLPLSLASYSTPRWFPDGRSILVLAEVTYSSKETRWGFHQINVETGAVTLAIPHGVKSDKQGAIYNPALPVWSPDGSKIFFMRWDGVTRAITVYDLETEREWSPDFRSKLGIDYKFLYLTLSPDGQQLAFLGRLKDVHSLEIAPSAGGEAREVLRLPEAEIPRYPDRKSWFVWTPDGRHLLFPRLKDEAIELWRIPVQGGEPENLGLAMGKIEYLSVHPDGSRIAFTGPGPRPGNEIWAIENFLPTSTASR